MLDIYKQLLRSAFFYPNKFAPICSCRTASTVLVSRPGCQNLNFQLHYSIFSRNICMLRVGATLLTDIFHQLQLKYKSKKVTGKANSDKRRLFVLLNNSDNQVNGLLDVFGFFVHVGAAMFQFLSSYNVTVYNSLSIIGQIFWVKRGHPLVFNHAISCCIQASMFVVLQHFLWEECY